MRKETPGVETVANGSDAANPATSSRAETRNPFTKLSGKARSESPCPTMAATSPSASIGPESGTATRFVNTPTTDTSSKEAAMIGAVAICAASEIERRFDTTSGGFPNGRRIVFSRSFLSGFRRKRIPNTAATESWKPALYTSIGLYARTSASIAVIKWSGDNCRPRTPARRTGVATTPARIAEGGAPATRIYSHTSASVMKTLGVSGTANERSAKYMIAVKMATCCPDIASTCVMPDFRKSTSTSSGMRERSPRTIPRTREDSFGRTPYPRAVSVPRWTAPIHPRSSPTASTFVASMTAEMRFVERYRA